MSRRSLAGAFALVGLLLLTLGTGTVLLLRYEPRHHRAARPRPGDESAVCSKACVSKLLDLYNATVEDPGPRNFSFTDEQINCFLSSEGLMQQQGMAEWLPEGISEPRVTFEPDLVRLSFRYQTKVLNTVISVALRPWVVRGEGNVLVVRVEGLHAGAVPFEAQWLMERLSDVARRHDIDINWYRYKGYRTAVLRFQPNNPRPTLRLSHLILEQGKLTVHSESTDKPRTAMTTPAEEGSSPR